MAKGTLRVQDLRTCWHQAQGYCKEANLCLGQESEELVPDPSQPLPQWVTLDKPNFTGGLSFLTYTVRGVANTTVSGALMGAQGGHIHGSFQYL